VKEGQIIERFVTKDGKEVIIRIPKMKDARMLLAYFNSLIKENAPIMFNKKLNLKEVRGRLKSGLEKFKRRMFLQLVVEYKGKIIACGDIEKGKCAKSHICRLGISVHKDFRGRGIGKELMRLLLKFARTFLKTEMVVLSVYANNKVAIHLYKKYGFRRYGYLKGGIKKRGRYFDEILMWRPLRENYEVS